MHRIPPVTIIVYTARRASRWNAYLIMFFALLTVQLCAFQSAVQAQTANINVLYADKVNEPVVFDGTASTGAANFDDGVYEWNFGDGFKAKIVRATHVYRAAGTYTVTLTVKASSGLTNTATTTVTVNNIPAATGNNVLTVVTNGSGNGTTTFNTIQAAVNRAATLNGSAPVEISIPAGTDFDESVALTVPTGNHYITLKSSALANLPVGKRADRSNLANYPTILAPTGGNAVYTTLSGGGVPSHHYRFQGIQFKAKPGSTVVYSILQLGNNETTQNAESKVPHHLILDRCLVYSEDVYALGPNPEDPLRNLVQNGINLNAKNTSVLDSYISNINWPGIECHAIVSINGTSALGIINNHVEAGSLNILFGGAVPQIAGSITKDVEYRRNRNHKPLAKRALAYNLRWSSKNNFETKAAQYFVIEGNLFDGAWVGEHHKHLVTFKVAFDTGTQTICKDIQFTNNNLRYGPNGLYIVGADFNEGGTTPADAMARILIKNILIDDIGEAYDGYGQALGINDVPIDLRYRHNTLINNSALFLLSGDTLFRPIIFIDNIGPHSDYGIFGDNYGVGNVAINHYLPGSTILKNVMAGGNANQYPANNYLTPADINDHFVEMDRKNYHISTSSPGKNGATDGTDVGADIDALTVATAGTVSGLWANPKPSDFDGDGKTDIAVWRPSDGNWHILQSSTSTLRTQNWGVSGDIIVPGDYDGDGKTDTAVFRPSNAAWHILNSSNNTSRGEYFGLGTDTPVPRDYDGDGKTDIAVWRSSNTGWYIWQSYTGTVRTDVFGTSTDKLVPGDYDEDGRADIAVYRPSTSVWYILQSFSGTVRSQQFGSSGDLAVPGLYDGDGKMDMAVFRPSTSTWYVLQSTNNLTESEQWGLSTDKPAPGDYDGDGRTDYSIFRSSTTGWHILRSASNSSYGYYWGNSGDTPVPSAYIPQ